MKKIMVVFVFIGGIIIGGYFLDPVIENVRAENIDYDNEYYYGGHCGEYYEDGLLDRFINDDLTVEQVDLITAKYQDLLLEYGITEDELYNDMEITHDIMLDLIEYTDSLDVDYYESYYRGHMFR